MAVLATSTTWMPSEDWNRANHLGPLRVCVAIGRNGLTICGRDGRVAFGNGFGIFERNGFIFSL